MSLVYYLDPDGLTRVAASSETPLPVTGSLTAPGARCNGLNHALDRGELLATTSGDAVLATIANWFGVPLGNLTQVDAMFPTLRAAHPGGWNVGFMT